MNIIPSNRKQILVRYFFMFFLYIFYAFFIHFFIYFLYIFYTLFMDFLYIFYTFFRHFLYSFYAFFIQNIIKKNTTTTWWKIKTQWNKHADGTYFQPKCLSSNTAVCKIMMICRPTCCDHIPTKKCQLTICSDDFFATPKYLCLFCQQMSCSKHYSKKMSKFICDTCTKLNSQ